MLTQTTLEARDTGAVGSVEVLLRAVRAEMTRLRTVRTTWWLLTAATLMLIGMGTLLGFEAAADPPEVRGGPAWATARFIMMPTQFVFLGLAALSVTSDYATGGIVATLQWTPRRSALFARAALTPGPHLVGATSSAVTSLGF